MSERIYFDSEKGRIERADLYLVNLVFHDGTVMERLEPRRLFPITDTEHYVSLLDEKEKEVALIRNTSDLDEASRQVLEDCFREYYMIPKISQILEIHDKFGVLEFKVMSDRGVISFRIRNRHSDIKNLNGTGRIVIRDSNDNRYEIPRFDELDTDGDEPAPVSCVFDVAGSDLAVFRRFLALEASDDIPVGLYSTL